MHPSRQLDAGRLRALIRHTQAHHGDAQLLHRLDCVLLVVEGQNCDAVGRLFGIHRRTVQRWVHDAAALGLQSLKSEPRSGRPKRMAERLRQAVQADLLALPGSFGYAEARWSGKRLAIHLQRCYGVQLGVRSCQRLIAKALRG